LLPELPASYRTRAAWLNLTEARISEKSLLAFTPAPGLALSGDFCGVFITSASRIEDSHLFIPHIATLHLNLWRLPVVFIFNGDFAIAVMMVDRPYRLAFYAVEDHDRCAQRGAWVIDNAISISLCAISSATERGL
jgi:hypothetical protein